MNKKIIYAMSFKIKLCKLSTLLKLYISCITSQGLLHGYVISMLTPTR